MWVMGEWAVGQWIVGVTSFQKIFALCGLKSHIVEIWRDVTLVHGRTDGRTTECEDRARILETEFAKRTVLRPHISIIKCLGRGHVKYTPIRGLPAHSAELHSLVSVGFPQHCSLPPKEGSLHARALIWEPCPQGVEHWDHSPHSCHFASMAAKQCGL